MAKVTTNENPANQTKTQTQPEGNSSLFGSTVNIGGAFGMSGDSSRAAVFASQLKEHFEKNGNTDYKFGTCEINSDLVSIAYLSFLYEDVPVCVLALFETGQNSIINYNDNNKQHYTTVASLVQNDHIVKCQEQIRLACGYSTAPVFVTMQVVPRNIALTHETVTRMSAQLVTAIEARGGRIGLLKTSETNKFTFNFHDCPEGAQTDANGIAQRADWNLQVNAVASESGHNNTPVLEAANTGNLPAPVVAVGYTNLRFTGPKDDPRDYVDTPNKFNMEQLSPEMTISQLDAITAGIYMSFERAIITLGGVGKIAQVGGWMNPLLASIKGNNKRKLSALAQHLYFATDNIDFKDFDKDPAAALKLLCKKTAAVVVKYRKGDGVAGLAALLAEIAYGDANSLNILMSKLDSMFDHKKPILFTTKYKELLKRDIVTSDIISTAVPCPAGNYSGTNGLRSLDDMDLITVSNRIGDQFDHFKNYVLATSYDNRRTDVEETSLYQMKLAQEFYGANGLRLSGDALDLVINPQFMNLLITYLDNCTYHEFNGVVESDLQGNNLFIGGQDYTVAGLGAPSSNSGFGTFGVQSGLTF